ncbi:type IVB secretion system protein IcmH/DotU [Salinicola tamaricis]|uniref:type IVB secretion system protein IcmH/DotU n=1 Tax=Salinicola tamaricis TaxID=1771309 RepID=UPI001F5D0B23|nr:type IVB secretion system protein IcmH/DotU [Salinicola tamaricis]
MTEALAHPSDIAEPRTLKTLSRDFISMVLMVRRGQQAESVERFLERVDQWLREFEEKARAENYSAEAVKDAQYALCAFLDESVLKGGVGNIREHVELHPFQYRYFGVHLAGEGFYDRLDSLRSDVRGNLDVLEVYHLCLALGFEGKYSLENRDQLRYIANTLGQDIARYASVRSTVARVGSCRIRSASCCATRSRCGSTCWSSWWSACWSMAACAGGWA